MESALGPMQKALGPEASKNYHLLDYPLFHMNIRKNAVTRVASWHSSNKVFKNIELSCREHGDHKPSMLQDILLKKQTEIDALNGEVIKIGSSLNIGTPLNSSLFHLIKAKENNY